MTDPEFARVVTRPDNVPIVAMVYLLGFFTWLGASRAVSSDERLRAGAGPREADLADTVLVWPDLVYIELIVMVILSVVLIAWSITLPAPLEQPANPVVTPNPSKAPWYFLGLQEMLVFFDASIAGVVLPGLIILGLMAIPYLDPNPKGAGYYTIAQRRFGYLVFQFGFLGLWIVLILIGTFMRGPNWSFFGLYEPRDSHKVLALTNVKLSECFWEAWLGMSVPQPPGGSGSLAGLGWIVWREIAGIVFLTLYFVGLPILLARTALRKFRREMGPGRYTLMVVLLLMMLMLPLKMILRWTFNVSYIVSIPEYFFNF
ncbi:MAG: cytochrome C [Planctomycetes bacterium]|nr:cytochrome C [Planctomycetota bacterium]